MTNVVEGLCPEKEVGTIEAARHGDTTGMVLQHPEAMV
jgi:hypothetical protein